MSYVPKRRRGVMKQSKSKSIELEYPSVHDLPSLRRKRTLAINRLSKTLEIARIALRDAESVDMFLTYYSEVKKVVYSFEEAHMHILNIVSGESENDEEEEEDQIRVDFDQRYFEIGTIHRRLTAANQRSASTASAAQSCNHSHIRLPKINLPKFSGKIKSWSEFYDIFDSLIHENKSLQDSERMQYLVSSLEGDALTLIRTYPATGEYYSEAYQALVDRYRNRRELAFTCWKEILNINLKLTSPHDLRPVLDGMNENITILKRLGLPTGEWDFVLGYLLLSKLDSKTRCEFEQNHSSSEIPSYGEIGTFLNSRCEALVRNTHFSSTEATTSDRTLINPKSRMLNSSFAHQKRPTSSFLANTDVGKTKSTTLTATINKHQSSSGSSRKCPLCKESHYITQCKEFGQMPVLERMELVKKLHLCFNCLKASHILKDCKSIFRCRTCQRRHHTLLHLEAPVPVEDRSDSSGSVVRVLTNISEKSVVMLSTARIEVRDSSGAFQTLRAIIDTGSQANFITEQAAKRLGILSPTSTSSRVQGLGQLSPSVSGVVNLDVGRNGTGLFSVKALTIQNICGEMPSIRLNMSSWRHVQHLSLADPDCHIPGPIDVLLGAEVFSSLLLPGNISGETHQPSALNSVFGWLLIGSVGNLRNSECDYSLLVSNDQLNEELQRFWEVDSFDSVDKLSPDEERCERAFLNDCSRDDSGRYIVALPFKDKDMCRAFPGSRDVALRRFHSLERRLVKDRNLYIQYLDFMNDYIESGHMSVVPVSELSEGNYYIPHHCVLKPDSSTTKLRVVFDASARDARGISLNETLLIGPKLQGNIAEILLRFRVHLVVFTADVRQMYRQILIKDDHRDYQRIFWRQSAEDPIREYRLNTVTYGVSAAPFLACRTVNQLISDESHTYPLARNILSSDIYVDDVVSGCATIKQAQEAKSEIIAVMKRGQFELRKWASNVPELLADLPPEDCLTNSVSWEIDKDNTLKILGLKWDPCSDSFLFEVRPINRNCTKRTILSELSRIFDPLGFLSPIIFLAKCLIQKLWILGIGWDDEPSAEIIEQWKSYVSQLSLIGTLRIPRCVSVEVTRHCQLHGFSDSSEAGYGAVVYLRMKDDHENTQVFFISAKSRVAPVRKISLPRLELCGAVLLIDLLHFVKNGYSHLLTVSDIFAWSDSTVVLSWIRSHSSRWKTFIANRVGHIQDTLPGTHWNHVPTAENPADVASRGALPGDLLQNTLWWAGPAWLARDSSFWPTFYSIVVDDAEVRSEERIQSLLVEKNENIIDIVLEKFSSIRKSQRVLAYCLRFIRSIRHENITHYRDFNLNRRELHEALLIFVRRVQSTYFQRDILQLKEGKLLSKQMRKLNPFLDDQGTFRVGGRLSRSGLEYEHKHPALLPRDSRLTYLIIETMHREHCHPGINTLQYLLMQQFWILSPKRAIRHCLSKCVQCFRTRPTSLEPFMSDLPATRVNQVKPFSIVGVDYAGPFRVKTGKHRGAKITKAYLCLFVCFTTKAVHLELASDLSSDAFIAALRRFVGRRGRVSVIYSDRGTNFIGASNQLNEFIKNAAVPLQIEFRFNPPSSPHFGGVWEIQVKAVKSHMYRVIGDQCLTFEELTTLLVQIESMLNSRPLCPLSSDPNDVNVLTPGHFLTLEPLTSVPDDHLTHLNVNRLGRFQLIQRFQQDFWRRWKSEYLQSLTQRSRWTKECPALVVGSIVVVKNENTIPLHWPLARITDLHPGPDGVVRVATIRTASGTSYKRPLAKLCVLPMQQSE